ncbi:MULTISPECIES: hypothetical protein [Streptomyces rochei group]|uniref:hypothetical protein n=1 Tax=Streptomyces rochei group TaxID=2867164 RepID=UPI001875D358|nr:hypothetical protein [Streptomyces vinaceusdrappus]GHC44243.1 hypothetical protein GCM10010308_74330 [Streptomyces vinaceusdrappus]
MQYDRTLLHRAAIAAGDTKKDGSVNAHAVARRLGVGPMAAWRLVQGIGKPALSTATAVENVYGVPATALSKPIETAQAAA